jgi:hypothetical protein
MGCGGSKDGEKEKRKIKSDFDRIGIMKYDEFFDNASKLLESAEKIREGLVEAPEEGKELTECWRLKDYKYSEVFKVALWTLSCNADGKISKCKASFTADAPFMHLDYFEGLMLDTRYVWDTCEKWLNTVAEAPKNLVTIVAELAKAGEKVTEFKISEDTASLGMVEKAKAGKGFAKNMATLVDGVKKTKTLPDILKAAVEDLKEVGPKLKEIYGKADEIGEKAAKDGLRYAREVFEKYPPGPVKTKEEIEKEKAQHKPPVVKGEKKAAEKKAAPEKKAEKAEKK